MDSNDCCVCVFVLRISPFFFFFFLVQPALVDFSTVNSAFVHYSRTHKFHFSTIFSLKMGSTALFTHLKIILLQCFQFQFSVSTKISSIQTDPEHYQIEPRKEYKILSPPREWDMIAIYGLKFKVAHLNIKSIVSILSYLWRI